MKISLITTLSLAALMTSSILAKTSEKKPWDHPMWPRNVDAHERYFLQIEKRKYEAEQYRKRKAQRLSAKSSYSKPVEIVQNDGEKLVLKVNKSILNLKEGEINTDFILYYNVEFNKDIDKLPRKEKKEALKQMRYKFSKDDSCLSMDEYECMLDAMSYMINFDAGEEWQIIEIPITKRGKYTVHFYREGIYGRTTNDATVAEIAGENAELKKFLRNSFGFISGKSKDNTKDVAFYPIWKQDIFVQPKSINSPEKIDEIAKKYAPISFMHSTEEYLPTSLEYMANEVDKDPKLDEEIFQLTLDSTLKGKGLELKRNRTVEFPYRDLRKVLPYNSDVLMVLSSTVGKTKTRLRHRTGTPEDATVYYSYMESEKFNQAYLNYHFLFPFDPKTGTSENPPIASHTFDRESMTIVLDLSTLEPQSVIYGAHLPNQLMGLLGRNSESEAREAKIPFKLQTWLGGRVSLSWDQVLKVKEQHPMIVMAQGSHGIYPTKGSYVVTMDLGAEIDTLIEGADGEQILYPNTLSLKKNAKKNKTFKEYKRKTSYKIKNLELGRITSTSWNNILAFSGDTVDVLGPMNAKFPPYTGREFNVENYINGDPCHKIVDGILQLINDGEGCYKDVDGLLRIPVYNWNINKEREDHQSKIDKEMSELNNIFE